ncbi:MAG: DUF4214 domain-containing protein [Clostridiales bacterium]|nr:DUF4214 domain-containing protein [Clostridiales bacterium]
MKMKKVAISSISLALASAFAVTGAIGAGVRADGASQTAKAEKIPINVTNFPDKVFREYVSEYYDQDQNGFLDPREYLDVDEFFVGTQNIRSLKGIEFFTNIVYLHCTPGEYGTNDEVKVGLQELDVSGLENLVCLECSGNSLKSLDVSKNAALRTLECRINLIEDLDISGNTELQYLDASWNQITELDVSNNTKLETLYAYYNKLTSLDIINLTALKTLRLDDNELENLDVSKNLELQELGCSTNKLKNLDFSKNAKLVDLTVSENPLETLVIGDKPYLETLACSECNMKELDPGKYPTLRELYCGANEFTKLDVSNNPKLERLYIGDSKFTTLDVSKNPELLTLDAGINQLTELDVSHNPKLKSLFVEENQLTEIDVSHNPELEGLLVYENKLTKIDVSHNPELDSLFIADNEITRLDLSKNAKLGFLRANYNKIEKLDISNCPRLQEQLVDPEVKKITVSGKKGEYYGYTFFDELSCWLTYDKDTEVITTAPVKEPTIGDFVERLYTEALGRPSEEEGKKYWIGEITSGRKTGADCGLFFLLGEEFTNRKLSEEDLVETLYKTFFGRESEPDGKAYWVGQLKNGVSRESVVRGFIDSKEWCNLCADYGVRSGAPTAKAERPSKKAKAFATRLYICCLGRDPEEAGLQYWALALTNLEKTGAEAAKQFFGSAEFINLATTDEEYVTRLYTTFMDRSPETDGFTYWVGQLSQGVSREQVLAAFAVSPEFTQICADYGIERGTV